MKPKTLDDINVIPFKNPEELKKILGGSESQDKCKGGCSCYLSDDNKSSTAAANESGLY